jgi:hypothetical protein
VFADKCSNLDGAEIVRAQTFFDGTPAGSHEQLLSSLEHEFLLVFEERKSGLLALFGALMEHVYN